MTFDPVIRNATGGRFSPTAPIDGLHPLLDYRTREQLEDDWERACKWVSFRVAAEQAGPTDTPRHLWYTEDDPEWPAHLYTAEGVDPMPPPVLRPLLEFTRTLHGCTRVQASTQVVGMDSCASVVHEGVSWAMANRVEIGGPVTVRAEHRWTDAPDTPFLEIAFGWPEYALADIRDIMAVDFAEKHVQEQETLRRSQPGGDLHGTGLGLRPEKVLEHRTGLAPEVIRCVPKTPFGEDPEGHSCFWAVIEERAKWFFNGADAAWDGLADHGGLARVSSGVHTPASSFRGKHIGQRLSFRSDPWWNEIDAAKAEGWPMA